MAIDQLSSTFAALADPTRRAILARLAQSEATVNELAAPFPMSAQAVGKHLRVLERAGLIERRRSAQLRPSRLRAVALKDAAGWFDSYRAFWEAGFDRMALHLAPGPDDRIDDHQHGGDEDDHAEPGAQRVPEQDDHDHDGDEGQE